MDEIALLYFQQLERRLRSKCTLVPVSVQLIQKERGKNGIEIYQYRAVYKCKKIHRVRKVWIDGLGRLVDPS